MMARRIKSMRKTLISPAKRVVIKVGSAVISDQDGLNREHLDSLTQDICILKQRGYEVILAVVAGGLQIFFIVLLQLGGVRFEGIGHAAQ